jgi:hypothetical protein
MSTEDLKINFQNQLESTDKKILELEEALEKAKEYKLKLIGGLETLALMEEGEKSQDTSQDNLTE